MTAPVTQADTPPLGSPRPQPMGRPDPEATERFRDALSRKGGKGEAKPAKLAVKDEGGKEPPAPPSGQVPLPFHIWPRKDQQPPAPLSDGQRDIGLPRGGGDGGASAQPSAPATHSSAADAANFAGLIARFDAGATPSASTHLALPGDSWRAEQVMIDQQGGGLSVSIDLGNDQGEKGEALKELEARLRARGLNAQVLDASRFGEADSRIA